MNTVLYLFAKVEKRFIKSKYFTKNVHKKYVEIKYLRINQKTHPPLARYGTEEGV